MLYARLYGCVMCILCRFEVLSKKCARTIIHEQQQQPAKKKQQPNF